MTGHTGGNDNGDGGGDWFDRHLGKIVIATAVLCSIGLIARAMTG